MKTIKIFIASSNELKDERVLMASLANDLSTKLEKVGIQVIAVEWENLDASMGAPHKQEEYNEKLHECDMCMVLYWTKFGMYTKTELDTAYNEKIAGKNPQKLWVYFKENDDSSKQPTEELKEFRDSFPTKYGHFYTPFANFDTLKAHFLLQFMEYQSQARQGKSIVEVKDGKVTIEGKEYVDLQNVPFAGNNEEYNELIQDIEELQEDLEDMSPDNPRYAKKADKLQKNKEKLVKMESSLWDTALMITKLSTTKCSERLQRAMDLFNQGDNKGAQAVLNEEEIERDVQHNLNLIKLGEEGKKGLKTNIDEFLLKIQAYENEMKEGWLQRCCELHNRIAQLSLKLYGHNSEEVSDAYYRLGIAYERFGDYEQALGYHKKALTIREKVLGYDALKTADSYHQFGDTCSQLCHYSQAIVYYKKALTIRIHILGDNHPDTAAIYNSLGSTYSDLADYKKALDFHQKALSVREKVLGKNHPDTAISYVNIGYVYGLIGDFRKDLEMEMKALKIKEKGKKYNLMGTFNNIGWIYEHLRNYDLALSYYFKALKLEEKILGTLHPVTAMTYHNIGRLYIIMSEDNLALEFLKKALGIRENTLGKEHLDTSSSYDTLGSLYYVWGDYFKAIEYGLESLKITEAILGKEHPDTAMKYTNIGYAYSNLGEYDKALECYHEALSIYKKKLGSNRPEATVLYSELAWMYHLAGKYEEALPWAEKTVDAFPNNPDHIYTLASVYQDLERYSEALEQFELCLKLYKEQENSEGINRTETKIAELKELMK